MDGFDFSNNNFDAIHGAAMRAAGETSSGKSPVWLNMLLISMALASVIMVADVLYFSYHYPHHLDYFIKSLFKHLPVGV